LVSFEKYGVEIIISSHHQYLKEYIQLLLTMMMRID